MNTASGRVPNPTFHGGATLQAPKLRFLFAGEYFNSPQGAGDKGYLDNFGTDFANGPTVKVAAQYVPGLKATYAGATVLSVKPPATATDAVIKSYVKKALDNGSNPDPQMIHVVFLPPSIVLSSNGATSKQGLGGYHSSYTGPDGKPVYYAGIVYSQGKNGIDFDGNPQHALSITASHEIFEAITDPNVALATSKSTSALGWYDFKNNGEISDLTLDFLSLPQSYATAGKSVVQKEWSNVDKQFEVAPKSTTAAIATARARGAIIAPKAVSIATQPWTPKLSGLKGSGSKR